MRQKLIRFEANKYRENILETGKALFENIRGKWNTAYFENDCPIIIELGCGRGEYTVGLAEANPDRNYVGIDIKGERIWVGSTYAIEQKLQNVAFLRTQIHLLEKFFGLNEIDEIWLTFPDPRPKERDAKRRLSHPRFMEMYRSVLKPEGWFKFKTDNTDLFEYTLELIDSGILKVKNFEYTFDLYRSSLLEEHYGIKTRYERIWSEKGSKIKYMKFQFD